MGYWNDDRGDQQFPDPWQELPGQEEKTTPSSQNMPATRPPPQRPAPVELLGGWLETSWTQVTVNFAEWAMVQGLVCLVILASAGLATGPMLAGYYRYGLKRLRGESADYNDLFGVLNAPGLKDLLVAGWGLALGTVALAVVLASLDLVVGELPLLGLPLRAVLGFGGLVALAALVGLSSLMMPLIHERGVRLTQAGELCLEVLRSDVGRAGLLGGMIGGCPAAGSLLCGVGILLGGPLGVLVGAQAFEALFPSPEQTDAPEQPAWPTGA